MWSSCGAPHEGGVVGTPTPEQDWLDVAVGYVMLKELLDEARADQASRN